VAGIGSAVDQAISAANTLRPRELAAAEFACLGRCYDATPMQIYTLPAKIWLHQWQVASMLETNLILTVNFGTQKQ
jgi:hypothetical protein